MERLQMGVQEKADILDEQSKVRRRKQNRESIRCYREKNTTDQVNVDINHHEDAEQPVFMNSNKQERADIQRNYRERKKTENGKLFLLKERERKKHEYTPIAMLDEQAKEKRRRQNRESVRRFRERKKTTDQVYVDITNQGNKQARGDIRRNCRERKKKENGEQYLLKERGRKKEKYTPISMLDEQSKEKRRKQNRESVRRFRERKKTDEVNAEETNHQRSKQARADIQRNYRERKKTENGELFLLKERERKKQEYTPISMLDEQSKEKRRRQNRESVRRHRERKKTTDQVKVVITNQGNKHARADKQRNCRKRKKKENGELYLLKERETKKQKYIPISMLDEQAKEKRRKQNRDSVQRFRERKKSTVQPYFFHEVNIDETNHQEDAQQPFLIKGNKQTRVDIQRNYRERKKEEDGRLDYLSKERERKKQKYIPISMLDEQAKEKRRKANRESVRRFRRKKKTDHDDIVVVSVTLDCYQEEDISLKET